MPDAKPEPPLCRFCEGKLKKIMRYASQSFGQFRGLPPPKVGDPYVLYDDGPSMPIVSLGRIKTTHMGWSMNVWLGRWGYMERGHFCNEGCAARWAERVILDGLCLVQYRKRKEAAT